MRPAFMLSFLFSVIGIASAQDTYLEIRAIAELDMQPLKDAVVILYEGSTRVSSVTTRTDGRFSFKMEMNKEYTVEVTKNGFISKRLAFNTEAPTDISGVWVREFSISVMKGCDGVDYSVLKEPVDIIRYNARRKDFESDRNHSSRMFARLNQVNDDYEKCLTNKYNQLIAQADRQFNSKSYAEARENYVQALEVRPRQQHPTRRIEEIDRLLARQDGLDDIYRKTIAEADAFFTANRYDDALLKYRGAATLKPSEKYPPERIREIEALLAQSRTQQLDAKEQDTRFNNLIAQGNAEISRQNFDDARQQFQQAQQLKPEDPLVKQRLAEIEKALSNRQHQEDRDQKIQNAYNLAIAQADKFMAEGHLEQARQQYQNAAAVRPDDKYPSTRIAEINRLQQIQAREGERERQAEINKQYQNALTQGDKLFREKNFVKAIEAYTKALELKPGEQYPMQRVAQSQRSFEAEEAQKQRDLTSGYQSALIAAEKALAANDYETAKSFFLQAHQFRPDDASLGRRATEMDNLKAVQVKERAEQQVVKKRYDDAIQKADHLFVAKEYDNARTAYREAATFNPAERYPVQRIQEIDRLVAANEAQRVRELEASYLRAVTTGNGQFVQRQYEQARTSYQEALSYKPGDAVSTSRLAEIDRLLKEQQANQAEAERRRGQYNEVIARADARFTAKQYDEAKREYQAAQQILSDEIHPRQRIQEIDRLVAANEAQRVRELEASYQRAVTTGNGQFGQRQYEQARTSYQEALSYKPADAVSTSRLAEIDRLLKEQQANQAEAERRRSQYNEVIARADAGFTAKQYDEAKREYQAAQQILSDEIHPRQRIQEIDRLVAANEAQRVRELEASYQRAVTTGNGQFGQRQYEQARTSYQEALSYKPADAVSTSRLAEIDRLLKEQQANLAEAERRRGQYNKVIARADARFTAKQYDEAKREYQAAQQILSDEIHPRQRIGEIDRILAELHQAQAEKQAMENAYKLAITNADNFFNGKQYVAAKGEYNKALSLKPGEAHPKNQLLQIDNFLAQEEKARREEEALQKQYEELIKQGDRQLAANNQNQAKDAFQKALEVKPGEQYPRNQIERINEMLRQASLTSRPTTPTTTTRKEPEPQASKPALAELRFKDYRESDAYFNSIKAKYQTGITQEIFNERNKITIRTIVIRYDDAREFREVHFTNWGGREYSMNGRPITQLFYEEQIKPREGEPFQRIEF